MMSVLYHTFEAYAQEGKSQVTMSLQHTELPRYIVLPHLGRMLPPPLFLWIRHSLSVQLNLFSNILDSVKGLMRL